MTRSRERKPMGLVSFDRTLPQWHYSTTHRDCSASTGVSVAIYNRVHRVAQCTGHTSHHLRGWTPHRSHDAMDWSARDVSRWSSCRAKTKHSLRPLGHADEEKRMLGDWAEDRMFGCFARCTKHDFHQPRYSSGKNKGRSFYPPGDQIRFPYLFHFIASITLTIRSTGSGLLPQAHVCIIIALRQIAMSTCSIRPIAEIAFQDAASASPT